MLLYHYVSVIIAGLVTPLRHDRIQIQRDRLRIRNLNAPLLDLYGFNCSAKCSTHSFWGKFRCDSWRPQIV